MVQAMASLISSTPVENKAKADDKGNKVSIPKHILFSSSFL